MEQDTVVVETLKTMLRQRGVSADAVEELGTADRTMKIGEYLITFSKKSRIGSTEIEEFTKLMADNGTTRGIFIVESKPSASIIKLFRANTAALQIFHKKQLLFDITTHRKVSPHRILTNEEKNVVLERYRANPDFMPQIDSQDAMAKWIGARPGDIVEILRKSETAGSTPYYRVCVESVS
jgi:DNA-directed RNA polymerase I, II, and III subunit RPABC1